MNRPDRVPTLKLVDDSIEIGGLNMYFSYDYYPTLGFCNIYGIKSNFGNGYEWVYRGHCDRFFFVS